MKNYTFIKPYKTTIGSKDANALLIGAVPFQEINFKIGDKINGSAFGGDDTNRVVETRIGNAYFNIPPEYLKEEAENQLAVKPTTDAVKQQNLNLASRVDVMTQEDKFYEMLGIKKTYGGWGIQSRPLGRLLVAVVLVGGYFAYKKFKK
jgi:hypothetical protein